MASPLVVLCVDGESGILLGHHFVMSIAGYEVIPATSAKEALQLLRDLSVDIVVLAQSLPDMPGTRLSLKMKRLKPRVPIVMITRSPDQPPVGSDSVDLLVSRDSYPTEFLSAIGRVLPSPSAMKSPEPNGGSDWIPAV
jgi:CheY-like chemotaxis protein